MKNKKGFKNKSSIFLATLAGVCFTTSVGCLSYKANAAIGGGLRRAASFAGSVTGGIRRASTLGQAGVGNTGPLSSQITALNSRLTNLETQRNLEISKNNSTFNKAVMISGLVSSAAIVAGVIGGVVQQAKFIGLSRTQTETDQKIQQDLSNLRYSFQEQDIPEAEKTIINYYKENYGVDITQKN